MKQISVLLLATILLVSGCSKKTSLQKFSESASNFNNPPELMSNSYPIADIYRVYRKGSNSISSLRSLREKAESAIRNFAREKGRAYVILGQRTSEPPYLLGNYPRVEIVFALTEKTN